MYCPKLSTEAPHTFLSRKFSYGINGLGVRYRSYRPHSTSNKIPTTIMTIVWAECQLFSPEAARLNGSSSRVNPAHARMTPITIIVLMPKSVCIKLMDGKIGLTVIIDTVI